MKKLILNFKSKDSKKIKEPKNFLGSLIFLLSLDLKFKISLFIDENLLRKN